MPRSHPRAASLRVRARLARGHASGLVAPEGLVAHGRGEALDYMLGERTIPSARRAARAAAAALLLAERPVISVNGNAAALCARDLVRLARAAGARLEASTFYGAPGRRRAVARELERRGARGVLGADPRGLGRLPGLAGPRGAADRSGILAADAVVVPLEDGDRAEALRRAGKYVVAVDLNPMSRTARAADVCIVDNLTRCAPALAALCGAMAGRGGAALSRIASGHDRAASLAEAERALRRGARRA